MLSHTASTSLDSLLSARLMDYSNGTINPADLSGLPLTTMQGAATSSSPPRGTKRSRSPEYSTLGDDDEAKRRKRGRPPRSSLTAESPTRPGSSGGVVQTPQSAHALISHTSPSQASPTKSTPSKAAVVKALPTVRDHTTDQLNDEKDEYIPREFDTDGEKKVEADGSLNDGRQYRIRTFFVANRSKKYFMLATECARVLGYRDSYLLFNKNRSLYKIIANQPEKDDLIEQEVLPYSYRSRQIAIVTARSMFRQFGSRVIVSGRRVRDDYWESKAIKQGFTEEDAAGEKRPGAAKAREAQAAAAEANTLANLPILPQNNITYAHVNEGYAPTAMPYPTMSIGTSEDLRPRDYSSVQRPRQEMTGMPYSDRTSSSSQHDILAQAAQAAEFNKAFSSDRRSRTEYLESIWNRPHKSPEPVVRESVTNDSLPAGTQTFQSPRMPTSAGVQNTQLSGLMSHQQHAPQPAQMMTPQAFTNQQLPSAAYVAQSPVRQQDFGLAGTPQPSQLMNNQAHPQPQRSPSIPLPGTQQHPGMQYPGYATPQGMWPPPQPHASPLSHQQMPNPMQQYSNQHMAAQQSPHMAQRHNSIHAQQQAGQAVTPQLHHSASSGGLGGQIGGHQNPYAGMAQQNMGYMQGMNPYGTPGGQPRAGNVYGATPTPQQFLAQQHGNVSQGAVQGGMQGWSGQAGPQQWTQGGF